MLIIVSSQTGLTEPLQTQSLLADTMFNKLIMLRWGGGYICKEQADALPPLSQFLSWLQWSEIILAGDLNLAEAYICRF